MTEKGAEYLGNLGEQPVSQPHVTATPPQPVTQTAETAETIPSQADLFKDLGERLGLSTNCT